MPAEASRALLYCAGGGIGDSLLASLVARALHSRYETVDALTLPFHREALERVPDIDALFVDEGGDEAVLAAALADRSYDAAVVTWATARTARIPQLARIPVRVGQARRLYSGRFTHQVPVRSELGDVTTHWSQILLDYARVLDCDTAEGVPNFVPTPSDREEAAAFCRRHDALVDGFGIVHAPNAIASARDVWPSAGWVALVRALRARFSLPIVLTGGSADRPIVERIARESDAIAAAGDLSIGAFGALAQRSAFFAGITTGAMHIAAAVRAPTAGIFPFQTDVPDRWSPLGLRTAVVRATYPCRPGERKENCPDFACIAGLNVPHIVAAVDSLLRG